MNDTLEDKFKLNRVLKYLNGTKNLGLRFTKRGSIDIKVYADASHGSHTDGKGHSGLLITLNDGPILSKSILIRERTRLPLRLSPLHLRNESSPCDTKVDAPSSSVSTLTTSG
jgi:hypothetical protein